MICMFPIDTAWLLLKDNVGLMTDVEMPDVNVIEGDWDAFSTPCECAEKIRQRVLNVLQSGIDYIAENPESEEYVKNRHERFFGRMEDWHTMSCEEILDWAENTELFGYRELLEECQSGMADSDFQMKYASEPFEIAHRLLKRQTKLYNWIPDYPDQPPIQQISAQPLQHNADYLEGKYPEQFWSMMGDDPSGADGHGASRWRADPEGNYIAVGIRGDAPIGDMPTTGPARNIKDGGGVRVVGKDDMPDPSRIVVMPRNVAHLRQFDRKAVEKVLAEKRRRNRG